MHLLNNVPFSVIEYFFVVNILKMIHIHFVFVGDLIMNKVIFDIKSFANGGSNVDILALVSEVNCCPSMKKFSSALLLSDNRIHIDIGWSIGLISEQFLSLIDIPRVYLLLHFIHHTIVLIINLILVHFLNNVMLLEIRFLILSPS